MFPGPVHRIPNDGYPHRKVAGCPCHPILQYETVHRQTVPIFEHCSVDADMTPVPDSIPDWMMD